MNFDCVLMNNDIVFEIAKYLDKRTGIQKLDAAFESNEVFKRKKQDNAIKLDKRLNERPTREELILKNIYKKQENKFDYIHAVIEPILHKRHDDQGISPSIAGRVKHLDFKLKKSILIRKLNLKNENNK